MGGYKPRRVVRTHSLNPSLNRRLSGEQVLENRKPSHLGCHPLLHHLECQFLWDTLGIGVIRAWFYGWKCLQWDTIQARRGTYPFPSLLLGPCQLYYIYTGHWLKENWECGAHGVSGQAAWDVPTQLGRVRP